MPRKLRSLAAALLLCAGLCACRTPQTNDDILSQKPAQPGKTPITVLVKHAFSIDSFEAEAEKVFPELDLIQVGNFTSNMGTAEYEARLAHDDLTDIVMTWPLGVGEEYWQDRLIDLSAQPFTGRYQTARLEKVAQGGKLYYLPGPSQIRAIVYNKTLFRENGWEVPSDFEGFLALCREIEASGIRALQLGLGNAEVLDTAFVGYSLSDCFSSPADLQWLSDYAAGKGSAAAHFEPAFRTFQTLIDNKVLQPVDLTRTYADRERMLFTRACAMTEDSVLIARKGKQYNGCTDEFGLMPFFAPGDAGGWARLYPVCYIGLNRHLEEPQNKEKYDLALRLMDYISSPEGQLALLGDGGAMYSSLNGVPLPAVPETADLAAALESGRCTAFPVLKNAQAALRSGLADMVAGKCTAAEAAQRVDAQNAAPPAPAAPPVLGEATADFTQIETGSFVTDAMRAQSGCEIALFLDNGKDGNTNGKGIGARLYEGPLTHVDLERILPDLRQNETGTLCKTTMTGENLRRTLEYAIPIENNRTGWFYYVSGLRIQYAPAAQPGTRLRSLTDASGAPIDPQRLYTVAVMDHSVPEDAMSSREDTGVRISAILESALARGAISPAKDNRFLVVQD